MNSDLTQKIATTWLRLKQHFTESFSGELLSQSNVQDIDKTDEWRDRRRRNAYRYISILLSLVVLPLSLHAIYFGELVTALGTSLLMVLLLLNIVLLSVHREALLSPDGVMLFCIALVILAVYKGQNFALFLLYPLLVALPVLLKPRSAFVLGGLSGLAAAPLIIVQYDFMTAVVIGTSLGLNWLVSAWLVFAVTEQARRLRDMAITDPLTGAYNRRYFEVQASKCLETWDRYQRPVSLLLLDIAHFKRINDRFGHAVGDEALKGLVALIQQRMRKVDILCRFGGEEFVLLLSESDGEQALAVANELRLAVESADILPHGNLTVSIGICDVAAARNQEYWFKVADAAMYVAKRNGRNRAELATPGPELLKPSAPREESVANWR
jgi:diguanylate cyclase (GGDEF)-like protein